MDSMMSSTAVTSTRSSSSVDLDFENSTILIDSLDPVAKSSFTYRNSSKDPGPLFFSSEDDALGSIMDVVCFDGKEVERDEGNINCDDGSVLRFNDGELLDEDDDSHALKLQLPDDDYEIGDLDMDNDDDYRDGGQSRNSKRQSQKKPRARRSKVPKFQMRIQGPKRKRGRPSKAEVAARLAAGGGPSMPLAIKTKVGPGPGRPKAKVVSAKAKALKRKINSSAWGKVHRERRNGSIDVMKRVIPGIGDKLDKAGVLELAINYILFLKKRAGDEVDMEFMSGGMKHHFDAV